MSLGRHSSVQDHTRLGRRTGCQSSPLPQGPKPWYARPKSSLYIGLCHLICEQKHTHLTPVL